MKHAIMVTGLVAMVAACKGSPTREGPNGPQLVVPQECKVVTSYTTGGRAPTQLSCYDNSGHFLHFVFNGDPWRKEAAYEVVTPSGEVLKYHPIPSESPDPQ